jgi:molecular chaperone HscC
MTVGIDLGTTNSLVAVMRDRPLLIPNRFGQVLTPSAVAIDQHGETVVGRLAKEIQLVSPDQCVTMFKRHMGSDWSIGLGKQSYSATDLSALVLQSLKSDAEQFLGEPVADAVITVPAYFNEPQRQATIAAGRLAGLQVKRILNEPTAAAIAYGLHQSDAERIAAVIDLGGGTFDVSLVDQFEGVVEIRASAGEIFLGGEDFTSAMVAHVLKRRNLVLEQEELHAPRRVARLRRECELAKRALTTSESVCIRIPAGDGELTDDAAVETITREEFEQLTLPVLTRIDRPLRRALGDARLAPNDIQQVIVVGGASRMPCFLSRVAHLLQQPPVCDLHPDEVVALGAAVQAALADNHSSVQDLVVTDVSPFTLGVAISREVGGRQVQGYFLPVISRNSTIPCSRVETVSTTYPHQTVINLMVYQGEDRRVEGNVLLGKLEIDDIPRSPECECVDVRFTYDLNGLLEVEATICSTGKTFSLLIARNAPTMSQKEIDAAVRSMQALKRHPRSDEVNRLALKRAERLYRDLPIRDRRDLDDLITAFEAALDGQDPHSIQQHRLALEELIARLDPDPDQP